MSKYQNFEKAMCLANSSLTLTTKQKNVLQGMLPVDMVEITPGVEEVGYSKKFCQRKKTS